MDICCRSCPSDCYKTNICRILSEGSICYSCRNINTDVSRSRAWHTCAFLVECCYGVGVFTICLNLVNERQCCAKLRSLKCLHKNIAALNLDFLECCELVACDSLLRSSEANCCVSCTCRVVCYFQLGNCCRSCC